MLLPATVVACFVLYYLVQAPFAAVVGLAIPMLTLYVVAPAWAASSLSAFDRDTVRLLAAGDRRGLVRRYLRALGMRFFSPPGVRAERRALVAAESGDAATAWEAYRVALREYDGAAPLRVLLGYAHASYALGRDAEAIRVYRRLLDTAGALPGVERNLAHALVRHGEAIREALELIERVERPSDDAQRRGEMLLVRALAHAKLGERERANELAQEGAGTQGELASALRDELRGTLEAAARPL
jgi:tetratricopeptide (TPR) repeat protein